MSERTESLTGRARLYLTCVADWSAPYEVAKRLGDSPPPNGSVVAAMLSKLRTRGLVEFSSAQNTYRITDAGRAALGAQS